MARWRHEVPMVSYRVKKIGNRWLALTMGQRDIIRQAIWGK